MALQLRQLYQETRAKYRLELICGETGLDRLIDWVYVAEDCSTTDFLYGSELVITTGMAKTDSPTWLHDFIADLIGRNTCGLILNMGKYLHPSDITEEIRALCEAHSYPLISMAWETHLYDITRDYYNRILRDTQTTDTLRRAFLDLARGTGEARALETLERSGYGAQTGCRVCRILPAAAHAGDAARPALPDHADPDFIRLRQYLKVHLPAALLCAAESGYWVFVPDEPAGDRLSALLAHLNGAAHRFCGGLGSFAPALTALHESALHAEAVCLLARARGEAFLAFDALGFFKLLLSVRDTRVLYDFRDEKLGGILAHDRAHGSSLLPTLEQYLQCGGSLQQIAAALYCHRNTVSYRLNILRGELGLALDDPQTRFELQAAFAVHHYLEGLPSE